MDIIFPPARLKDPAVETLPKIIAIILLYQFLKCSLSEAKDLVYSNFEDSSTLTPRSFGAFLRELAMQDLHYRKAGHPIASMDISNDSTTA